MITYLLRFLFLLLIFFLFRQVFTWLFAPGNQTKKGNSANTRRNQKEIRREQVEKDPVCGMFVAREAAVKLERKGEDLYFCSEKCRAKFLEAPEE